MQWRYHIARPGGSLIRVAASAALLLAGSLGYASILSTSATVRANNSLLVDVQVTTGPSVEKVLITYQTAGVDPLVSRPTQVSSTGSTTITIGRLRANRAYTYTVDAFDRDGGPAGTAIGTFTTGALPPPLLTDTYKLTGRTTVPLVILPLNQAGFRGYVALDLHSADAPQIVWYYINAPSNASGVLQVDTMGSIVRAQDGSFLFGDGGTGGPTAADVFYREITPDGNLLTESPADCSVTRPTASISPAGWIWGQGNDTHEQLVPGADGVLGTVLHLGKIVKDPFFDAGQAPQGKRLQAGIGIRRWNQSAGTDEIVWDPFNFLDPLTERTDATNSDPGNNSNAIAPFPCAGASLQIEEWMHGNSLQVAPTGVILLSVRHLDTVMAISPQLDKIAWRIGRFKSDFTFPNPGDQFYHEHFVRMLDNGNLLLFDNGNGRPAAQGGQYTRALELALDWSSMTATKVWEYRHQVGASGGTPIYKYADRVGTAQRLANGNTIVWFGADIDPTTLQEKSPQTQTLVEADASPEAGALAVLDVQIPPGNVIVYRALPVETIFGEVPASGNGVSLTASPNPIPVTGAANGTTTISWNAPNSAIVEIHVGGPNGPLFASGGNQGSSQTGPWVADGTTFYLQDVTGGKPPAASNTLATLVVHLQRL
ncbi:MAG: aryl-sulfate sulfotransferase [Candidatus Sulfopaludibacter sp.]|nr:aryl-sulfate sulfotransferase [Candidatus Sulfopaludibacter sp.]